MDKQTITRDIKHEIGNEGGEMMSKHTRNDLRIITTVIATITLAVTTFNDYDSPWSYILWDIAFIWLFAFIWVNWLFKEEK